MTVEEYDSKKEVRDAIERIEKALYSISQIVEDNKNKVFCSYDSRRLYSIMICDTLDDPIIAEGIKQVLIERKKELVEEFSK